MKTSHIFVYMFVAVALCVAPYSASAQTFFTSDNYYLPYYSSAAPTVPTGVSVVQNGQNSLLVSWKPSVANLAPIAGYRVYRNGSLAAVTSNTSFSDSRLADGTYYTYAVSSYDVYGRMSIQSQTAGATANANYITSNYTNFWNPFWPTMYPMFSQSYIAPRSVTTPVPTQYFVPLNYYTASFSTAIPTQTVSGSTGYVASTDTNSVNTVVNNTNSPGTSGPVGY